MTKLPEKIRITPRLDNSDIIEHHGIFITKLIVAHNDLIDYLQEREQPQEKLYTKAEVMKIIEKSKPITFKGTMLYSDIDYRFGYNSGVGDFGANLIEALK